MKVKLSNDVLIDLEKLIESRLLFNANSGGGKSHGLRRFIEQSFAHKQIIVIDPEGEFGNMRGEYDFVYCGKGGDAPVESRSAALLAVRLLELKASAIIDLYELPMQERKHFVRLFFDSMINAPKELWHDCIVILDEAHIFAPEKDQSESGTSVADMASRGRKRGFCLIPATQRLAKLNKDVAAECNNKIIGRASLDIDRKRAAEELGFTTKEEIISLRNLDPGEFYCFGPAISRDVVKTKIGEIKVAMAKRGQSAKDIPLPTEKVKKILGELADLPKEAQEEARTVAEYKTQVAGLKRELTIATQKANAPRGEPTKVSRIEVPVVGKRALAQLLKSEKDMRRMLKDAKQLYVAITNIYGDFETGLDKLLGAIGKVNDPKMVLKQGHNYTAPITPMPTYQKVDVKFRTKNNDEVTFRGIETKSNETLSGPEQKIIDAIAWFQSIGINEPEQTAVAFLAGYTYGGGGFNNPRGALRTKQLVEYRGDRIALTPAGVNYARPQNVALTKEALHDKVLSVLPGPEGKLLRVLIEIYPEEISKDDLALKVGYAPGSGGFNNPCGRLRSLGLVEYPRPGTVKAKSLLFIE